MFINYTFSRKHNFKLNIIKTVFPFLLIGLLLTSCREEFLNFNLESFDEGSRKITEQAKPGSGGTTGEPIVFLTGEPTDVSTSTTSGISLIGGAESDTPAEMAAFQFLVEKSGGGDFVVLRASGSDGYNSYIYSTVGGVNSVRTLLITSRTQADHATTLSIVQNAEAIFIAGGDQSDYLNFWKDTKLEAAINETVNVERCLLEEPAPDWQYWEAIIMERQQDLYYPRRLLLILITKTWLAWGATIFYPLIICKM